MIDGGGHTQEFELTGPQALLPLCANTTWEARVPGMEQQMCKR